MRKILIFLIFVCCLTSCISTKKYNQKLNEKHPPQKLKEDLNILQTSLEEAHPGVFWYLSQQKFKQEFDSLKNQLTDSLTSLEFYRKAAPLVSSIKCGHTRLVYPGLKYSKAQKDSLKNVGKLPLGLLDYFVLNDSLFIKKVNTTEEKVLKPGMQILKINGDDVEDIIKKEEKYFSSDGYNTTFYPQVLNKSFANYYYAAFPKSDSVNFLIKDADTVFSYTLKRHSEKKVKHQLSKEEQLKKKKLTHEKRVFVRKNRYRGVDENQQALLDFKIDTYVKSTAILTVKSFAFPHNNFHRFFRESFKRIKEKNIQHLILDLRNNGGGNLMSCNLLFRYLYDKPYQFTGRANMSARYFSTAKYADHFLINSLRGIFPLIFVKKDSLGYYSKLPTDKLKNPKKYNYQGDLYVLINGYSFSATSLLAANLQEAKRGIFIGEETGGGYNQCTAGSIPYLSLPHTALKLRLPLKVIRPVHQRALYGRGVFPKYPIKTTLTDLLQKKDVALQQAEALIR
ncbi:MAG: S41 family peptidase [Sphingobacteriales bacterium]|nr:S41 family peptidase [Sphingobacteriales bacterium]